LSKLLTDLMEAERRRRQLAINRNTGDTPEKADDVALARAAAEAAVATADHEEAAVARAATRSATARSGTATAPTSSRHDPQPAWWRLFAATTLALMAGIGIGVWLGKPPAVSVHPWSADQDMLRLRLDDRLMDPPLQGSRSLPRDRVR
jgi:hypothetical protein